MKLMRTEEAVGQMLCHDITQIIRGVKKGPVFKKGHIITEADIPVLLSVGKDHIYIWEVNESMMHENDAAMVLYELCRSENMHASGISEGKVELIADCDGLLQVDRERLRKVNFFGEMMIATRHDGFPVKKGDKLAGTRIIPLLIEKEKMERVQALVSGAPILRLLPFRQRKVGIVTTGNEVYYHRIEDTFTPVVEEKLREYGGEVIAHELSSDDAEMEMDCIRRVLAAGADMVICTGGMSVDPDDRTPYAIRELADRVVSYGAPVLPGAMFMLAYKTSAGRPQEEGFASGKASDTLAAKASTGHPQAKLALSPVDNEIPILGLPGCVMYAKRTIFDLILPRLMAGEIVDKESIDRLGNGGLCLNCPTCTFPNCGFGKG